MIDFVSFYLLSGAMPWVFLLFVLCSTEQSGKHTQLIHWPEDNIKSIAGPDEFEHKVSLCPVVQLGSLWSYRGKRHLLKMVSGLTSGICISNIVL